MSSSKIIDKMYFLSILLLVSVFWAFLDMVSLLLLVQLLFFGVAGIKILLKKRVELSCSPYIRWAFIWIFFCLLTTYWSGNVESTISYTISVVQVLLVGVLLVMSIEGKKQMMQLEQIIIIAGIVLVTRLLIVTPSSSWGQERLGIEMGMHVNHIALNLLISLMFTLKVAIGQKKKLYWPLVVIFLTVLVMTASKKAIIIGILALLVALPLGKKGVIKKAKYLLIMLALIAVLIKIAMNIPIIYDLAAERMEGFISLITNTGIVDESTTERQHLIQTAWKVFLDNPLLGVGLDGFRSYNTENAYAHSNFLEILADCGILGFVIYYSLYFIVLKKFFGRYKQSTIYGVYVMIITFILILEITQVTYYYESVQFVLAVLFLQTINSNEVNNVILPSHVILRKKMT